MAKNMRVFWGAALLLLSCAVQAQWPPAWLDAEAGLARARVPDCPNESAEGFSLRWQQGRISGRLQRLSLDLTCSRSGNSGVEGERDALSLLLTLPPIDFEIDELRLHLPGGELAGPAGLRHQGRKLALHWRTGGGELVLALEPHEQGWRWQGQLPGGLFTPAMNHQPLAVSGGWQPGRPLVVALSSTLPRPLVGEVRLDIRLAETTGGWRLLPDSRLTIPRLGWRDLTLDNLVLSPVGSQSLAGPWSLELAWQGGHWARQAFPGASLQLNAESGRVGDLALELAPGLRLAGYWRQRTTGWSLVLPRQSLSLAGLWAWLGSWLAMPADLVVEAGEVILSARAEDLPDPARPLTLQLALEGGRMAYRELRAEPVAATFILDWRQGRLLSRDGGGLSIGELDIGVPVREIHAALGWRQDGLWLSGLTAQLLGGQLALSPMALAPPLRGQLHLRDIALAELLTRAAVPGLTGDGRLHGRLPFVFDGRGSVSGGRLWGDPGWISYRPGEALQASAESNLSLGLTLGLLTDLQYQELAAEVSMDAAGEAVITSRLRGRAPVMGRMHPVNFNYQHRENLLELLESLRFARDLGERLPARLEGGTDK